MPILYIIAGPNGVGKTTFADHYLPDEAKHLEFVNVDLIARGLSPYDPDSVAIEAGRIALRRIRELIEQRAGFTWETTLSGKTAMTWLRQARQVGYELKAYFLWVRDLEIAMRRVRQRVTEGGHNIREEVSRRRFMKTIQNFFDVYRPLLYSWKLLENDASGQRLLAIEKAGRLVVRDRLRFESICRAADLHL